MAVTETRQAFLKPGGPARSGANIRLSGAGCDFGQWCRRRATGDQAKLVIGQVPPLAGLAGLQDSSLLTLGGTCWRRRE